MEFIRNIILVDADIAAAKLIKNRLCELSPKVNVHIASDRLRFTEFSSKIDIKAVFINGNIGKKDLYFLFRYFSTFKGKGDVDIPVFFTAEDFSLLQDVINNFSIEKMVIIPSPVTTEEIVEKLLITTLGKIEKQKLKRELTVDKEFLNVFIISTKKVIGEMSNGAKIQAQKPTMLSKISTPLENGLSAKIVLSSQFFQGTFFVVFPLTTFLSLSELVLSEKQTSINRDNQDLASELANIIYGQAKKTFSEAGYNLDMAIPTLFKGDINHNPVYLIPFHSDFGPFTIAIAPGLI